MRVAECLLFVCSINTMRALLIEREILVMDMTNIDE